MNKISSYFLNILLILLLFVAFGCSKNKTSDMTLNSVSHSTNLDQIHQFNKEIFASANIAMDRGDYLIGPGDLLDVEVFESEKLNTTVRVNSRGIVSLVLLGEITIEGLTAYEAEGLIEEKYKASYIKDPHVSIFIKEHFSQKITVIGRVKNPGTYDYPSKMHLLDVLALAGGLQEDAGRSIQLRRINSGTQKGLNQTFIIDLDKLINDGQTELNVSINGGDIIFIPEAGLFYVEGAVRRPGEYHIKKTMSVKEAISSAGGLEPYADAEEITILRYKDNSNRDLIKINLEEIDDQIDSLLIKDRDIISVNESFWGKVMYGSGFMIGVPGLGYNYRDPSVR
jgi:polysaccharide export outer membrane protein